MSHFEEKPLESSSEPLESSRVELRTSRVESSPKISSWTRVESSPEALESSRVDRSGLVQTSTVDAGVATNEGSLYCVMRDSFLHPLVEDHQCS